MKHSRLILGFILLYFIILGIGYARAIPLFEASDEAEHFIYVHHILERGALPEIQSLEDMAKQDDLILRWNNQSHHAPLYYLTSALIVSWTERADIADYLIPNELIFLRNTVEDNPNKWLHRYTEASSDTHIALYILRGFNILIGAGTLILIYLGAKQIFEEQIALLSTFFTASIPTFIAVNASVSNDGLTIFLYSAGLLWMMYIWRKSQILGAQHVAPELTSKQSIQQNTINKWDTLLISFILAGIALTKLTGVTLFGVIYLALIVGIWKRLWNWQTALQVMIVLGLITLVFAGWWYWRNFQLYGDPLALDATASIWGRTEPLTLSMLPEELLRIGKSFWMMVGYLHFPVFAPDSYYIYLAIVTIIGQIGLIFFLKQISVGAQHVAPDEVKIRNGVSENQTQKSLPSSVGTRNDVSENETTQSQNEALKSLSVDGEGFREGSRSGVIYLMLFAIFVVTAMLLYGTRSVDISYGRLLLPAIAAFAPLLIVGWRTLLEKLFILFRRDTSRPYITTSAIGLLIVPLAALAILTPLQIIPHVYPTLEAVEEIPNAVTNIEWQTGNLEIRAVDIHQQQVNPNDTLSLDLYIRGNHPDNPALIITAVDSIRIERLDHIEVYPGMAATNLLPDDTIYRLPMEFQLDTPDVVLPPRVISINIQWVNLEDDTKLTFDNGENLLEIQNVTFVDPRYKVDKGDNLAQFNSDDSIALRGFNFADTARIGESINLSFIWNIENTLNYDWTLTIQLFDSERNFVTQNDGVMWWYPTSRWATDIAFEDVRTLDIPSDIEAGTYEVRVGWYRQGGEQFIRMESTQPNTDNLYILGDITIE